MKGVSIMKSQSEKVSIICAENCGNSPKKQKLRDISISLVNKQFDVVMNEVTDDITLNIIGREQVQDKDNFKNQISQLQLQQIKELQIENIITHGNVASLNGIITFKDDVQFSFCNVYQYKGFSKNAKIKAINTYIIRTN